MLCIAPAATDGDYYTGSQNYYEVDSLGDPYWFGKAAETLGLIGKVSASDFEKMYDGKLPDGTVLGRGAIGEREHRSGWDMTFSAPKSVSVMALAGRDKRLIGAVHEAAKEAVTWMEKRAAYSRFGESGKVIARPTGNLAVAMFMHDLTREQEPGLHVHAVAMNATQGPNGKWRSLESRFFYDLSKEGGLRFQQSLALLVRQLGYELDVNTTKGTFELSVVPKGLRDAFSTRSQQIIGKLAEVGLTRETATPQQRQAAAISTRRPKEQEVDRVAKAKTWRQTLRDHGIGIGGHTGDTTPQNDESLKVQRAEPNEAALEAVRLAAQVLAERQIVFSHTKLIDRAAIYATGQADRHALRGAVEKLEKEWFLQAREMEQFDRVEGRHINVQGWTTTDAIQVEKDLIDTERAGRGARSRIHPFPVANRMADQAASIGTHWEYNHSLVLLGLLTTENRVVALDGSLERASNRQVVLSYVDHARERGLDVRIMAPSSVGAAAVGALLKQPATTIASQLLARTPQAPQKRGRLTSYKVPGLPRVRLPAPKSPEPKPQVWLVTDTAQLRPTTARDLMNAAKKQNARVILMNEDRGGNNTTSRSIQNWLEAGMTHFQLPGHQGQDRNEIHLAVAALARGEPALALEHFEKAGGRVVSIDASSRSIVDQKAALQQRRDYIADRYVSLDDEQRANTRVLDLTNKGKEALNAEIRQRLADKGELSGPTLKAEILIAKPLTATERTIAISYQAGDVIRFGSAHGQTADRQAIGRGDYFVIQDVQVSAGIVMLEADDGRKVAWTPAEWGAARASVYRTGERDLAAGDQIIWTRKDATIGVTAQQRESVVNVHPESGMVSVDRNGQLIDIDVTKAKHFEHAYADTVGKGLPAEQVIAHLPTDNVELANLKALTDVALRSRQLTIVTENRERLAQAAEDRKGLEPSALDGPSNVPAAALDAVRTAVDILAERNSIFAHEKLTSEAARQGLGVAHENDIERAINAFAKTGVLIHREALTLDPDTKEFVPAPGWTTLGGMKDEQNMLAAEQRGRYAFAANPILPDRGARHLVRHMADDAPAGRAWNSEQHVAAVGLLSSPHRVTGLQGLAGTAKTTTVLSTFAQAAKELGHNVMAMAPTTVAAKELGNALGAHEGRTVAWHLHKVNRVMPDGAEKSPVWIVDEASMVSAKDMRDLIRAAEQHDARLFLTFDVLQLGSVGAGRAAGQLIEGGMTTHYLDRIVRQSENPEMMSAIYDIINQNPSHALRHIVKAGGNVLQIDEESDRHQAMAKEYVARPPNYRAKTVVIDPTREGVAEVSKAIRTALNERNELTGKPLEATFLEDANLTLPEKATPTSYRKDQVVHFPQTARLGEGQTVKAGSYLVVANVKGAEVVLRDVDGRIFKWEPRARRFAVGVYHQEAKELQIGEQVRWTRNNKSINAVSGRLATVVGLDRNAHKIEIEHQDNDGKGAVKGRHWVNLKDRDHQHFDYGWAFTTQRAQGRTAHPIINAPSWRRNTVTLAAFYVQITRTPENVHIVTDDRNKLVKALGEREGSTEASLDQLRGTAGQAVREVRRMAAERANQLALNTQQRTHEPHAQSPQQTQQRASEHVASPAPVARGRER